MRDTLSAGALAVLEGDARRAPAASPGQLTLMAPQPVASVPPPPSLSDAQVSQLFAERFGFGGSTAGSVAPSVTPSQSASNVNAGQFAQQFGFRAAQSRVPPVGDSGADFSMLHTSLDPVSMHSEAVEHKAANNGAGMRSPFANKDTGTICVWEFLGPSPSFLGGSTFVRVPAPMGGGSFHPLPVQGGICVSPSASPVPSPVFASFSARFFPQSSRTWVLTLLCLLAVLMSCLAFRWCALLPARRDGSGSVCPQVAYPAPQSNKRISSHHVFVDSGAYPNGIYNTPAAFGSTLVRNNSIRLGGLFDEQSSEKVSALGLASMWAAAINPETGAKEWRNVALPGQIYSPVAKQSLFATEAAKHAGIGNFVDQRCLVLPGGWVVPFLRSSEGLFIDVVFARPDDPPPLNSLPDVRLSPDHLAALNMWRSLGSSSAANQTSLLRSQSVPVSTQMMRMPVLTDSEMHMWRVMGFPFNRQWRWAYSATTGHNLTCAPTPVHMFTDFRVLSARMRALPFSHVQRPRRASRVGALIYIDFQEGFVPSVPHGFKSYCSILDDFSSWGRMIPVVSLSAESALDCLRLFMARIQL